MKKKLLIIYHSQSGKTERLAEACFEGALKEGNTEVRFKTAFTTTLFDVQNADALIIATPEYFGAMSGAVKDFFDRTYYPARENNFVKPYALIICCENDGTGAERQIEAIANGYILKKTLDTLIIKESEIDNQLENVAEMGQTFAAGLHLGIF
jgi:multimeric flavodoxin WrbA